MPRTAAAKKRSAYVDGGNADCGSNPPISSPGPTIQTRAAFFQCSVSGIFNAWYYVAVTRDGSNTARIFIDGVLRATTTNTPAPTSSGFSASAGRMPRNFSQAGSTKCGSGNVARYASSFTPQTTSFYGCEYAGLVSPDEAGQTLADASAIAAMASWAPRAPQSRLARCA